MANPAAARSSRDITLRIVIMGAMMPEGLGVNIGCDGYLSHIKH
jgi:hypothetical protein